MGNQNYACRIDPDGETWYEQLLTTNGKLARPARINRVTRAGQGRLWSSRQMLAIASKLKIDVRDQYVDCEAIHDLIMRAGVVGLLRAELTPSDLSS
jgi:hypothetical protein